MVPSVDMVGQPIDKYAYGFASKNISKAKNETYTTAVIILVLLTASYGSFSVNSKAISPNADTVLYRINTSISVMENLLWTQSIEFLRQRRAKIKRSKCYIIVDETYDSYTGKLLRKQKKHKKELTKDEKSTLRYIHKYKPKKGDTGSFKYLVFALVFGNTRRVLRVKALKRKEKYKDFIVRTLIELKKEVKFECVLFDRGFYDGSFVEKLKTHEVPFIIRAKISKTMKKEYGFYKNWKCYEHFPIGNDGKGNLILGVDYTGGKRMRWAFITNLKFDNWYKVREIYKKRWNIENIFKATDGIQLRVQTNNPTTRMYCVCLSFLLYNAWQTKQRRNKLTLLDFIMKLSEDLLSFILRSTERLLFYRDKLKVNILFWNRIIKSI